jgi:hypothetical protein
VRGAAVVGVRELLRGVAAVKSATIQARKRFAAELAQRDEALRARRSSAVGQLVAGETPESLPSCSERPSIVVEKTEPLDADVLQAYRMRRWWLDRYTLDEIRELAGCLR